MERTVRHRVRPGPRRPDVIVCSDVRQSLDGPPGRLHPFRRRWHDPGVGRTELDLLPDHGTGTPRPARGHVRLGGENASVDFPPANRAVVREVPPGVAEADLDVPVPTTGRGRPAGRSRTSRRSARRSRTAVSGSASTPVTTAGWDLTRADRPRRRRHERALSPGRRAGRARRSSSRPAATGRTTRPRG